MAFFIFKQKMQEIEQLFQTKEVRYAYQKCILDSVLNGRIYFDFPYDLLETINLSNQDTAKNFCIVLTNTFPRFSFYVTKFEAETFRVTMNPMSQAEMLFVYEPLRDVFKELQKEIDYLVDDKQRCRFDNFEVKFPLKQINEFLKSTVTFIDHFVHNVIEVFMFIKIYNRLLQEYKKETINN